MLKEFTTFHLVSHSPWPLYSSMILFSSMINMVSMFANMSNMYINTYNILMMSIVIIMWMRDIVREGTFNGDHSKMVAKGLKIGMMLFITSEVLFFFSFFWSLFYIGVSPPIELGMSWPSWGIKAVDYLNVPLLGTIILISSGVTLTICHSSMLENKFNIQSMLITILLGLAFSILQMMEYYENSFSMSDSMYGSIFYMMTGFHGFHVLVGTMMLMFSFNRMIKGHFSKTHMVGFEASAWYWHFVDVVWLLLFLMLYWWSSM